MNNDIALSFDKAEYYSLEEASEYLNRKHGIDNITPKKLLKHIVSYDTPTFVFAKGFNLLGDYDIELKEELKKELENTSDEEINKYFDRIDKYIDMFLSANFDDISGAEGGFIGLNIANEILTANYCLTNIISVTDIIPHYAVSDYNNNIPYIYLPPIAKDVLFDDFGIKSIKLEYMAIIEPFYGQNENKKEEILRILKENIFLEYIGLGDNGSTLNRKTEKKELIFKIKQENLILFHKDLTTLESQIIEYAPIPPKEIVKNGEISGKIHPRASNNYAKIISALSNMAGVNLTEPYGKDNKAILETMERLGLEKIPSNDTIAKTLKEAHAISK